VAVTSNAARNTARATDRALSVAIIDDEPLARRGVRQLVSVQAGFHVVGEAETGTETRELIESLERACEAHYVRCLTRNASERDDTAASMWPEQIVARSVGRTDLVPVADSRAVKAFVHADH
jgi:hypothetical protein